MPETQLKIHGNFLAGLRDYLPEPEFARGQEGDILSRQGSGLMLSGGDHTNNKSYFVGWEVIPRKRGFGSGKMPGWPEIFSL